MNLLENFQRSIEEAKDNRFRTPEQAYATLATYNQSKDRLDVCDRPGKGQKTGGVGCITNADVRSAIASLGGFAKHGKYSGDVKSKPDQRSSDKFSYTNLLRSSHREKEKPSFLHRLFPDNGKINVARLRDDTNKFLKSLRK